MQPIYTSGTNTHRRLWRALLHHALAGAVDGASRHMVLQVERLVVVETQLVELALRNARALRL